jgi:hypothetical protein
MPTLDLDIQGLDDVVRGLSKLDGEMRRAVGLIAKGVGYELKNELQVYPPPPPESTYRRTGTLGRSWHVKRQGSSAIVGNPTPYAPYVQSESQQAWMHEGRWQTDADAIQEIEQSGAVERIARRVIGRILRMTGLG